MTDGAAEAELLLKAARGDEAAFLLLYERHRTPVFRFACRMLGSAQLAEDVTQECFLSILRRPEAFRAERASLRTYLCAIARHLALKQLRKRGQETVVDEAAGGRGGPRRRAEAGRPAADGDRGRGGERGAARRSRRCRRCSARRSCCSSTRR